MDGPWTPYDDGDDDDDGDDVILLRRPYIESMLFWVYARYWTLAHMSPGHHS